MTKPTIASLQQELEAQITRATAFRNERDGMWVRLAKAEADLAEAKDTVMALARQLVRAKTAE